MNVIVRDLQHRLLIVVVGEDFFYNFFLKPRLLIVVGGRRFFYLRQIGNGMRYQTFYHAHNRVHHHVHHHVQYNLLHLTIKIHRVK
jgi:hypothetical protein